MQKKNISILLIIILLGTIILIISCIFIFFLTYVIKSQFVISTLTTSVQTTSKPQSTQLSLTATTTLTPVQATAMLPTKQAPTPTIPPPSLVPSSTAAAFVQDTWCVPWNTEAIYAQVYRVLDGSNIEVLINGDLYQIRYLGIAAPDEDLGANAQMLSREENMRLVSGKQVLLVKDRSDTDEYNRLLRYVFEGVTFINLSLVESGYAIADSHPPDISCDTVFNLAEIQALQTGRGIWAATATPSRAIPTQTNLPASTGDIIISIISYEGDGWQQPDEFVEIKNNGEKPIQLENWILRDSQNHLYRFPNYVIIPGQYCRIYTDLYNPGTCGFKFNNPSGIWSDEGECAYLFDSNGYPIHTFCYE